MSTEVGSLHYDLNIDDKKLKGQLDSADRHVSGLGNKVAALGKAMAAAFVAVGVAVAAIGVTSVKAFQESQNIMAQTNAVIKSTGGVAGVSADQVSKLASSLQKVTAFSDETIQSGENLLLTFTNIGKDIFPQATEVMLDMSQALGQDVKSSAIQLGKALQDPILGVTALRRVGVNFNAQQQETIKRLVETGRAAEAQALILKELQTEFGGSARAAGETFGGQLAQLKNSLNDIQESLGRMLVEALVPLVSKLAEFIAAIDWQAVLNNTINALRTFWQDYLVPFGQAVLQVAQFLWGVFGPSLTALWNTLVTNLIPAVMRLWNALNPALMEALKVIGIVLGAVVLAAIWLVINALNVIIAVISIVIDVVAQLAKWFGNLIGAAINAVSAVLSWFSKLPGAIGNIVNSIVNFFRDLPGRIGGVIGGVVETIQSPFKTAFNAIAKFWNNTVGKLSFKAPDWVPGIGGKGWEMPKLPILDMGGLVTKPTLAMLAANNRPEVVIPLDKLGATGGMTINIGTIQDREDADYLLRRLNRDTQLEGMGISPVGV